jgi:murein L,D-transpeptidase YcbB/YkuD
LIPLIVLAVAAIGAIALSARSARASEEPSAGPPIPQLPHVQLYQAPTAPQVAVPASVRHVLHRPRSATPRQLARAATDAHRAGMTQTAQQLAAAANERAAASSSIEPAPPTPAPVAPEAPRPVPDLIMAAMTQPNVVASDLVSAINAAGTDFPDQASILTTRLAAVRDIVGLLQRIDSTTVAEAQHGLDIARSANYPNAGRVFEQRLFVLNAPASTAPAPSLSEAAPAMSEAPPSAPLPDLADLARRSAQNVRTHARRANDRNLLQSFQSAAGLPADGKYGPATRDAMAHAGVPVAQLPARTLYW